VLLGRGGSDTAAALFAARLGASRCEIWTDVPGMFTADPRRVPDARLLRRLDYAEAQEIASTGAKVLHPRCLAPVRRHGIPMHIRWTERPKMAGTTIQRRRDEKPRVRAISTRRGQLLVSMDTPGMWQQVGFLADVFAVYKQHGVSIDLVSTSEMNVTVSLDPAANVLDGTRLPALVRDLERHCTVRVIGPCATISLVGRRIRAILHRLGPALAVFEEQRVHLVSQAASDLNLSVVVDEEQAERLVRSLHWLLFQEVAHDPAFGPTWSSLSEGPDARPASPAFERPWWHAAREALLAEAERGTPAYVYHGPTLDAAADRLAALTSVDRVFYAVKANSNAEILRRLEARGLGFECVSPGEIDHVFATLPGLAPDRVVFTPNFAPRGEYAHGLDRGVWVTLDNLHPLEAWPDLFAGREVMVRVDPGKGRGHHEHVKTAGAQSKFGVSFDQLDRLAALVERVGCKVVGLHAHSGSGIRTPDQWAEVAYTLAAAAERFPAVRHLDVGGGLSVAEKPGKAGIDLAAVDASLAAFRAEHPKFALWVEPGRFLVAEAGVILTRVTQLKTKGPLRYVGVDVGMNSLIRPALYGAWHAIIHLTRLDDSPSIVANVVGPICESGDTLGYNRRLPETVEGDVLLIATAGAYGRSMASHYNLRPPAREVMLE
jgi:diaminopimelate decarboxylase/aspartate kinase